MGAPEEAEHGHDGTKAIASSATMPSEKVSCTRKHILVLRIAGLEVDVGEGIRGRIVHVRWSPIKWHCSITIVTRARYLIGRRRHEILRQRRKWVDLQNAPANKSLIRLMMQELQLCQNSEKW
jgi:hypothetical protein